jgi:hypothetical protein
MPYPEMMIQPMREELDAFGGRRVKDTRGSRSDAEELKGHSDGDREFSPGCAARKRDRASPWRCKAP